MERYEGTPGFRSYARHYPQITDLTMRLQVAHQYQATQILSAVDNAGWSALEFADEVLATQEAEPILIRDQDVDYLAQVRAVIDAVASDTTLAAADRARIVSLLRNVEQALLDIKSTAAARSRGPRPRQSLSCAVGHTRRS